MFARALDSDGAEELMEVLTRQMVFPKIILPFLKTIDYGTVTKLAQRWRIAPLVVLDPRINFGKPIVEGSCISTNILARAYTANDKNAEAVADWYNIHARDVLAAVHFEETIAA